MVPLEQVQQVICTSTIFALTLPLRLLSLGSSFMKGRNMYRALVLEEFHYQMGYPGLAREALELFAWGPHAFVPCFRLTARGSQLQLLGSTCSEYVRVA